jgi:FOG: PAS/PAC domain
MDFLEMIDASKTRAWSRIYQEGFAGQIQRFTEEFRIGGKTCICEVSVDPIRDGDIVTGLSCFARDITLKVINDRRLKAAEMRFRALIENSSDITVVLNGEGQIVYGSPSIEKNFGISPSELTGASFYEFLHPEDIAELAEKFLDLLMYPGK